MPNTRDNALRNLDHILRDPLSGLTWENRIMAADAICELLNLRVPRFDGDAAEKAEVNCHCDKLHRSDLCASGQQVRAVMEENSRMHRAMLILGAYLMEKGEEFRIGEGSELLDAYTAALTPAPQPEGRVRKGTWRVEEWKIWKGVNPDKPGWGDLGFACRTYEDAVGLMDYEARIFPARIRRVVFDPALTPAPDDAQTEAVPVGCGYPCGYDCNGACFDTPPAAPAPGIAEALKGMMKAYKEIADSGDAGYWKAEEMPEYQAGVVALRALEGRK